MELTNKKINFKNKLLIISFLLILVDLFIYSDIASSIIKIQDLSAVITFIFLLYILKEIKYYGFSQQFIFISLIYFFYLAFVNLIYIHMGFYNFNSIFYILKEFEYIIAMFLFIYIYINYKSLFEKLFTFFVVLNILYGYYQIFIGEVSFYGIRSITTRFPAGSGAVYFICSIWLYFLFINKKKKIYLLLSIMSVFLIFATVSRTNIIGIAVFLISHLFIKLINLIRENSKINSLYFVYFSFLIILIVSSLFFLDVFPSNNIYLNTIEQRFSVIFDQFDYRIQKQINQYDILLRGSISAHIFGRGKGSPEILMDYRALGVDNQFTRLVFEMGIIGALLWFIMLFILSYNIICLADKKNTYLFSSFLLSYMAMGMGLEVLQTTIPGIWFWTFIGILYADSLLNVSDT